MIGRAYLWGLAASGSAGVKNVFDVLRGGIDSTLLALGRSSVHDLSPDDIIVPADFAGGCPNRPSGQGSSGRLCGIRAALPAPRLYAASSSRRAAT